MALIEQGCINVWIVHQYQFFIDEEQAKNLLEVYHYEWNAT